MTVEKETIQNFIEGNKLTEDFLVYAISVGLRQLQDDDLDEESKAEMMERFAIRDEEEIESLIDEVDELSWRK